MQARGHRTHDSGDLGPWGQRHLLLRRILNLKVLLEPKELVSRELCPRAAWVDLDGPEAVGLRVHLVPSLSRIQGLNLLAAV